MGLADHASQGARRPTRVLSSKLFIKPIAHHILYRQHSGENKDQPGIDLATHPALVHIADDLIVAPGHLRFVRAEYLAQLLITQPRKLCRLGRQVDAKTPIRLGRLAHALHLVVSHLLGRTDR